MNITISDPTPAPEMPVMWAAAIPNPNAYRGWALRAWYCDEKEALADHADTPGSRLIKI